MKKNIGLKGNLRKANLRKTKSDKDNLIYWGFGAVFVLVIIGLIFGLNEFAGSTTGAAVMVESYGLSDQLRSSQAGKLQTYVEVPKSVLKELLTISGRKKLAEDIMQKADFLELAVFYQNNPPAPLPYGAFNKIKMAVSAEKINFVNSQPCLYKIAINHQYKGELKLALISELVYQNCQSSKNLHFAFARHSYYNLIDEGFICSEDGEKLFTFNKITGEIDTDSDTDSGNC